MISVMNREIRSFEFSIPVIHQLRGNKKMKRHGQEKEEEDTAPSSSFSFPISAWDQQQKQQQYDHHRSSTTSTSTTKSSSSSSERDAKTRLPESFSPNPYSVLIGRGKVCAEATGNRRLKVIVSTFLDEYSKAPTRIEKSIIVSKIVDIVNDASPVGGFIKFEDGAWWQVSDNMARERVGSLLRDCLSDQYKSSSKAKLARRRSSKASTTTKKNKKKAPPRSSGAAPTAKDGTSGNEKDKVNPLDCFSAQIDPAHHDRFSHSSKAMSTMHEDMERIDIQDVLIRKPPKESGNETKFDTVQKNKSGSSSLYDEWAMEKVRESQARSHHHHHHQRERRISQSLVNWPRGEEVDMSNHDLLVESNTSSFPSLSDQRPSFSDHHHGHPRHMFNEGSQPNTNLALQALHNSLESSERTSGTMLAGSGSSSPFPSASDIARAVAASAAAATRDMERGDCDDHGDDLETTGTSR